MGATLYPHPTLLLCLHSSYPAPPDKEERAFLPLSEKIILIYGQDPDDRMITYILHLLQEHNLF